MREECNTRMLEVQRWLDNNVQRYSTPKRVTLSAFEVDWRSLSGSFQLTLDESVLEERLKFGLEASGKTKFYYPMFHSPLGVPASYAAIELTVATKKAILQGLSETIPIVKGLGLDPDTGHPLYYDATIAQRIKNVVEFRQKRKQVNTLDYSVVIEITDAEM